MSIFNFIAGIFKPATDLIDNLHTSDEERMTLRNELAKIQEQANSKLIDLEAKRLDAMSKVQIAESSSKYAITATWRPITSMALVGIIIAGSFGLCEVGAEIYDLAKVFLGTYAGGRSLEKLGSVIKLGKGS